jgi:hypothetical protein
MPHRAYVGIELSDCLTVGSLRWRAGQGGVRAFWDRRRQSNGSESLNGGERQIDDSFRLGRT